MCRFHVVALLVLAAALSGCTGRGGGSATASPSPEPSVPVAASPAAPESSPSPAAAGGVETSVSPTPVSVPTSSPEPNLLSTANGTVLRSYSPAALDRMNDGNLGNAAHGVGTELPDDAKAPFVFTFELPTVATISEFQAALRNPPDQGPPPSVTIAVSTTGADSGFTDVGTISGDKGGSKVLSASTRARWVRVTANQLFDSVGATGTLAPPHAGLDPTGIYIEEAVPEKYGSLVMSGTREGDRRAKFVAAGSALTATECTQTDLTGTYVGRFNGRTWTSSFAGNGNGNPAKIRAVVNDDASIIAGLVDDNSPVVFMRTAERAAFCVPRVTGTGAHHVLVLDQDPIETFYPATSEVPLPGYTFEAIGAGMLDAGALAGKDAAIMRGVCKAPQLLAPQQIALLLQWVAAGHKLILGGTGCGSGSDFTWLPYPFTSAGSGPESTNASLIQVENDALGTNDKNDARYVDVKTYVQAQNSLDSADVVTTTDPHWCGHFFIAKTTNLNGFVQTYAVDGKGILIYDGFNGDDGRAPLQRLRQLELALPVPADLPCSQNVTESFVLEPNQEGTFAAGTAQQARTTMSVLANQGWNGRVTVKAKGDLPATVSPAAFDMAGGTQNLDVSVKIPASTKAGVYTVNVLADSGNGKTAQASYSLTGTAPLKTIPKTQKKIRIYGIHFDVDSAHIQPRSESVIGGIAQYMHETPSLRFEVQGHTDSDGGAAYNLGLSQRRAQAVVDDLVARYRIARGRLKAKGYGLTQPVAPNTTAAGKALNRRVELLRLQ
ncbi:MAG TPA: OmpA family protein [Candidatus Elarobacter sp.]|nr:OmpA family protein [Candidatus Elarobacter sp.]